MILLASAKTMRQTEVLGAGEAPFLKQSKAIREQFKLMSKEQIGQYFKIKNKTLDTTYNYYQTSQSGIVIKSLQGQVMKQITADNPDFIKKHVYVLDAMYGILNGYDQIELFRLDFTCKTILEVSYYNYWQKEVNHYIEKHQDKAILLLTSEEYSKLIDSQMISKDIYTLAFEKEIKSSVHRKQVRGKICNYCIAHQITDYRQLDGVKIDEYQLTLNQFRLTVSKI